MKIAIFPGSFDPFTIGHADIVRRGLQLFDRVVIAVGYNAQKTSGTPIADRVAAIEHWAASLSESAPSCCASQPESAPSCCASQPESAPSCCAVNNAAIESPRVKVIAYSDLTVDLAQREGARFLLRGVRSVKDFEYERDMAAINSDLAATATTAATAATATVPSASPEGSASVSPEAPLETVLLIADPRYAHISSSVVRELQSYGRDVTPYLP